MQYGIVIGKHRSISQNEIQAMGIEITKRHESVALVSVANPDILSRLAGIVKRGVVKKTADLVACDLIGASERELGTFLKKRGLCKRYKEVEPMHTDEEVKTKGKEYVKLDDDFEHILEITTYQDIARFSAIDFDKPVNSMQIGMMPAKLTQIMVNIAIGKVQNSNDRMTEGQNDKKLTVYDPFMGLGTTYMVANSLGHNVIGSDINIAPAKQNLPRWEKQAYYNKLPITLFAHDVFETASKPFLNHVDCIVTEGWLGHIITAKTKEQDVMGYAQEVEKLYKARINNTRLFYEHMTIVCTIPRYIGHSNTHIPSFLEHCESKKIRVHPINEVYSRPSQKVGRKILIINW